MKIAFLTTEEPFYLPRMFDYIFKQLSTKHTFKGVVVPPVYKGTTKTKIALRYIKSFGLCEGLRLTVKVILYKLLGKIPIVNGAKYFSLKAVFKKHGIQYIAERDVNRQQNLARLKKWDVDLLISISCPQIFKSELISLAPKGCLNLHGAILPKYRGVMPSFWMLANNEKMGGLTLFYVNTKIDAGDVLVQRKYEISPNETLDSIIKKSKQIGAEMVIEAIKKIENGQTDVYPLQLEGGSYFGWPERADVLKFRENGRKFR